MKDETTGGELSPELTNLAPKWLLNGFPKAGLHLCELMMQPLAKRMPAGQMHAAPFVGTFAGHSFTTEWTNTELFLYHVARLKPGHMFYSHIGHQDPIEAFLYYLGVALIFCVRDFRDVAVSQAFHVTSENDGLAHADKELYRNLGSFDEVLKAVIVGINEYAGVMDRWALYAPWVEADWIYLFRFERAIREPEVVAAEMLEYGILRSAKIFGFEMRGEGRGPSFHDVVHTMAETSAQRERSLTFRKGNVGDWRAHFTDEHKRLFKESDKDGWLVRLGYETSADW